ncbi:hypothetical protein DRW03_22360 [Corallococcus sp. H22C18031201]|uniref:SCP2 sterol-binding domain-containing protein n=1 Tax=Citreicoccus inhibens TaxID=2849499 RepID=UPI000E7610E6|nr:SCP2 sterol-binding domain-containing protein [Citreicoccus inhibens]MBU8897140.1 SCP2 sterol-binding domain-containing protein [Citreicoccus inhibens]RJS19757.1 hypothetical protein DRW03_22360 [Corallococcus sp. H22C18031201]
MWNTNATTTGLSEVLQDFQARFNDNPRAKKLVTGWDRSVLLDASNTGNKFVLAVQDHALREVRKVADFDEDAENLVHLQGDESVLTEIFSGRYNPATALVDGAISIFSSDRDKVKLEALAMILWRLG